MSTKQPRPHFTAADFIAKWTPVTLPERAASQEHFIDLCRLLGQPTPAEHDATGAEYAFEKGVAVTEAASRGSKGAGGFADVWWKGKFGWEYKRKGKYKTLKEAYRQLCQYREALENPPLLIVSDITRIEIHTNFTATAKQVHRIELADLDKPENLDRLRRVFTDPHSFRPTVERETITREVAAQIAEVAQSLQSRGNDPHDAAHFLMKCMFCLFAEDIELLPPSLFTRLLDSWHKTPDQLTPLMTDLFEKMARGGAFGVNRIEWFNGGLFDDSPALELTREEAEVLLRAAKQDWSAVEPSIFGTLFERSLDPEKRAQIGAHYTSTDDIMLVVEPVILAPLRAEWTEVLDEVDKQLDRRRKGKTAATKKRADAAIHRAFLNFRHRLATVRILDPACGSGNFLYVAIRQLLELEKQVITRAAQGDIGMGGLLPDVRPTQLHGIEINRYAAELAQVVIWIGYLQWMRDNGFVAPHDPILDPLQSIDNRDAILNLEDPAHPQPAEWPQADFIIGNPPFLGDKMLRSQLGDDYVSALFAMYGDSLPNGSDFCCYWFELARCAIRSRQAVRAGLLATQGIRGGANREVLVRIGESGAIFEAWSDRNWFLDGASVHVSIICFDDGSQQDRHLNGIVVAQVNTDLSSGTDLTRAGVVSGNRRLAFLGNCKGGSFDVDHEVARGLAGEGGNPNGKPNTNVLTPYLNSQDLTRRSRMKWLVDYGVGMPLSEASAYEAPMSHVREHIYPSRSANRNKWLREHWWLHQRARPAMREAISKLRRFIVTPTLSKHRLFAWIEHPTLPDHQLIVFARSDDYFFGVLHSAVHELWALRMGTQLEDRPRYTPTTCFETFPLPWSPGAETEGEAIHRRIGEAAAALNQQRERWLNPPEWIDPIAKAVDDEDDFADVPETARELIRRSAIMARAAKDPNLKKRTLTNLYNQRPTWLRLAHRELDAAVLAAYATVDPAGQWSEGWADLWADTGAGRPLPADHPLAERRAEVDQAILANLLRLNFARSGE